MPGPHWAAGCEKNFVIFQKTHRSVIEVYVTHFLTQHFYIVESNKATEASKVFVKEIVAPTSRRKFNCLTMPAGPVLMEIFPEHIKHFLANFYKETSIF